MGHYPLLHGNWLMITKLRVFCNAQLVPFWHHALFGNGNFPLSKEDDKELNNAAFCFEYEGTEAIAKFKELMFDEQYEALAKQHLIARDNRLIDNTTFRY